MQEFKNKSIQDLHVRRRSGANIVGLKTKVGEYILNPPPETIITEGSKLFVLGMIDKKEDLKKIGFEFDAYERFELRIRPELWMIAELDLNWKNVQSITMYMEKTDAYVLKEKKSDCVADESTYKSKMVGYAETANELSEIRFHLSIYQW